MLFLDTTQKIAHLFPQRGVFLTGIENSDPVVDGKRRDQLKEAYDFYTHYERRLENIKSLGIDWLRIGPSYSATHMSENEFDFSFFDNVIEKCRSLKMNLIVDLLHFGLPRWINENNEYEPFFQNKNFPKHFAHYVRTLVKRYPDITYFTPVNEPFVTAFFSTKLGIWNESIKTEWKDDSFFIKAISNIAKAAVLARKAIEEVWIEEKREVVAVFLQNESFEVASSTHATRQEEADRFNLRRFAALDLILGRFDMDMKQYLISQGMSEEEYTWFMDNGKRENTTIGIDHYPTCVHILDQYTSINCTPSHPSQFYTLIIEYANRYQLPLIHMETNGWPDDALRTCQETYDTIYRLRIEGYPIMGMAWYGDEYQVGWHHALTGPLSFEETHVGLFYKGEVQPVGKLFSELAQKGFPSIT